MEELKELREREVRWRQRLVGTSLVMESGVDQDEATQSFRWLGKRYGMCNTRDERRELLSTFRATFLIGLTAVGGRDYDEGTFWPFVSAALAVDLSQSDIDLISTRYKEVLSHYGLRRFATPMANVGEVLMHAGVPVGSIQGFLRLLVKQDLRGSGTSGAMFAAWAKSQNKQSAAMLGLDAPTWRFLREGGEVAEDFVDRCLSAFDAATSGNLAQEAGLSRHVLDEVRRLVETRALVNQPRRGARAREVLYVPILNWDAASHGVAIVLPALEVVVDETVRWTLTSEGRSASYVAEPPWPGIPASTIIHPLPRPTKAVSVRARPGEHEWDITVVDPDDPMLIFDVTSGSAIPARNSLPRDRVIVGAPRMDDLTIEDLLEFDGEWSIVSAHQSPFGWESWAFATVDLSNVRKVRRGEDRWRFVSTSARPQLTHPDTLDGATMADESVVYGGVPSVVLPAASESSSQSLPWVISLSEEATGRTLWTCEIRPTRDQQDIVLWPDRPSSLLGTYVVAVRGALGRGITRRVAIAEGWRAKHQPSFRYLNAGGDGLEAATVVLSKTGGSEHLVSLNRGTSTTLAILADENGRLETTLRVPHMTIAVTRGGTLPVVTLLPQSIDIESLEYTQLRVTAPAGLRATLGLVASGVVEQTIDGGISNQRAFASFNIGQFADTARTLRSGVLQLRVGDRSLPVGTLRPRKLADEVTFDTLDLALHISPAAPEGLTAAIYPTYAPWEAPTIVAFSAGAAAARIPRELTEVGRATVMLRIDDPWSPSPWPDAPDNTAPNVFPLSMLPLRRVAGSSEVGFSRWLSGLDETPNDASALPLAAKVLSLLGKFETVHTYKALRSQLSALFGSYPALFIDSAMQAPLSPSALMRLVIDSGLAATASEIPPPVPGSWTLNSFLGLIGDYEGVQERSDPQFISNLENFAGIDALTLLESGVDPHAKIGRFDDNARIMSQFPPDRLEQLWAAASPIPGRLLQLDSRTIAARQLFDARNSRSLRILCGSSRLVLEATKAAIFEVLGPDGLAPVDVRIGSDGWRNLPALSMSLAIVARLAARDLGNTRDAYVAVRDHYAQLAEAAPAFVEQDLVIAELWIMNWRSEWTR